jgi:hypothetical protein
MLAQDDDDDDDEAGADDVDVGAAAKASDGVVDDEDVDDFEPESHWRKRSPCDDDVAPSLFVVANEDEEEGAEEKGVADAKPVFDFTQLIGDAIDDDADDDCGCGCGPL